MVKRSSEQGLPDYRRLSDEVLGFYDPEVSQDPDEVVTGADVAILLDLGTLKKEIRAHHSRGLDKTIDLSFTD
jgi:hypothetical protein